MFSRLPPSLSRFSRKAFLSNVVLEEDGRHASAEFSALGLDGRDEVWYSPHIGSYFSSRRLLMPRFTQGELEIMRILWERGELKPAEIHAHFPRKITNASLRSYLAILLEKGHVVRRRVGKAYYYRAKTRRESTFRVDAPRSDSHLLRRLRGDPALPTHPQRKAFGGGPARTQTALRGEGQRPIAPLWRGERTMNPLGISARHSCPILHCPCLGTTVDESHAALGGRVGRPLQPGSG